MELHLAGMLPEKYKETLNNLINKYGNGKIRYIGKLEYNDMILELLKVHTVVIPSLWIENYPNTALEAVAVGCLVLGSERGGMREIIGTDRFIFHVLNKAEFVEKMEMAYQIGPEEYESITLANKKRVTVNNSFEMYYQRLKKAFDKLNN